MTKLRSTSRDCLPWLLLLIVVVAYAKCLTTFFVQDDFWFLRDTFKPLPNRAMLTGVLPEYLRPVPTYWLPLLNRIVWGMNSCGFHVSQMICMLATVYAIYRIVFRQTESSMAASVAAIIYGLSKVHLYTLAWVAGGIDTTAGCFMTLALLAIVRYEQGDGSLWPIGAAIAIALLSKESAIILVGSWAGAVLVRALLRRFLPSSMGTDDNWFGDESSRRPTVAGWLTRKELRIALLLAGVVSAYVLLRINLIHARPELGLDFSRFWRLIANSIVAILPIIEPVEPIKNVWVVLPAAIAAGAFLLRPVRKAHEAALGLLLWLSHAAIFAVSVKLPPQLELYYAHFNVIGLALLAGLCCAGLLERCDWRWMAAPLRVAGVLLLGAYAYQSTAVVRESIATAHSAPMYSARYSLSAYNQFLYLIGDHPYHTVIVIEPSEHMWWATGFGDMFLSMFPGVDARFDGKKGYQACAEAKTDETTLVVRQVSEFNFEIVR